MLWILPVGHHNLFCYLIQLCIVLRYARAELLNIDQGKLFNSESFVDNQII